MNAQRQFIAILISGMTALGAIVGAAAGARSAVDPSPAVLADGTPPPVPPGGETPNDTKWD